MKVSAIICAGGKGERAGLGRNKVLASLNGQPVIYQTCEKFYGLADEIIISCREQDLKEISTICSPFNPKTVVGGITRFESVLNALAVATGDIVLIHDGARPFIDRQTIARCIEDVTANGSAICAVPVTDTVAQTDGERIVNVPDRSTLYRLQTPQAFLLKDIKTAYGRAVKEGGDFTDDSSVYLKYIGTPHLCEGAESNVKLTYKSDFDREYAVTNAFSGNCRVGFGSDIHAFGENCDEHGNCVTLCGVKIPSARGLIAHSDGDVPVHALMDALLSACGLNDIGHYFPDNDDKFLNADSMELLKRVVALVGERGFKVANVSIAILAEKPKLAPHIENMKSNIAEACRITADCVGVSAGTCEGLGFVGKGLGIQSTAVALVERTK